MTLLFLRFLKVKEKGWIKSERKGPTGIGYTFEKMINKEEDDLPIADFNNIEIKVKQRFGKGKITLFNANPDNEVFAIKRIYNNYGIYKNHKISFMTDIDHIEYKRKGNYLFKLHINHEKKAIYLQIYDKNKNLIEEQISWSFELLNEKIRYKIENLSIVKADIKIDENKIDKYYYYYHIDFYEIKGLDSMLKLIEEGIIYITFNITTHTDIKNFGNIYNHGISFNINIKDIEKLYIKKDFKKNN